MLARDENAPTDAVITGNGQAENLNQIENPLNEDEMKEEMDGALEQQPPRNVPMRVECGETNNTSNISEKKHQRTKDTCGAKRQQNFGHNKEQWSNNEATKNAK